VLPHEKVLSHGKPITVQVTGVSYEEATTQQLWDVFELPFGHGSELFLAMGEMAARGDEFVLRGVELRGLPHRGTFSLMFRRAEYALIRRICVNASLGSQTCHLRLDDVCCAACRTAAPSRSCSGKLNMRQHVPDAAFWLLEFECELRGNYPLTFRRSPDILVRLHGPADTKRD